MNRKRFYVFSLVCLGLIFIGSCASTGKAPSSTEKTLIATEEMPGIEQAREFVILGAPDTLIEGHTLLQETPAGMSPEGQSVMYIAEKMLEILYPQISFDVGVSLPPAESVYPEIFEDVRNGIFPVAMERWDSPIMLNASACAALFTEDADVLTLCKTASKAVLALIGPSSSVIPLYMQGVIAEKRDNAERALTFYRQAYTLADSMYPAKWHAVTILRSLSRNETALPLLQSLTSAFPKRIEYQLERSFCHLDMGAVEKALEVINGIDIEASDPQYDTYLWGKSLIQEAAGDIEDAVTTMEILQEQKPEDIQVMKRLGLLFVKGEKKEKGITVLELAVGKGLYDAEVYKQLLRYYVEGELWSEARAVVDDVEESLESPDDIARAAEVYLKSNEYEQAKTLAGRVVEQSSENADYLKLYAQVLIAMDEREGAAEALRKALTVSTSRQQRSDLFYLLSFTVQEKEQKAEMLQNALFENMENVEVLVAISYLYRGSGEYKKSYRYIKQAAALAPDNREVMNLYAELEGLLGE